jgi:hypothetical protein
MAMKDGTSGTVTEDRFDVYNVYMPYNGYDTLNFLRNSKDTIVLIGNGKKEYFEEVFRGGGLLSKIPITTPNFGLLFTSIQLKVYNTLF